MSRRVQGVGAVLLVLALAASAEAKVKEMTISEVIRSADVVVLAEVIEIRHPDAVPNEKAVLILDKKYKRTERVRVVPGVCFLSFAGRGRMPVVTQDGKLFALVQDEVRPPEKGLQFQKSPTFPYDSLVNLDELRAFVKTSLAP